MRPPTGSQHSFIIRYFAKARKIVRNQSRSMHHPAHCEVVNTQQPPVGLSESASQTCDRQILPALLNREHPNRRIFPASMCLKTRQRLLERIHRRYQTVTDTVTLPAGPTFPFVRIANPDRVLDEVAAEEDRLEKISGRRSDSDQLHLPYWAELWDSALALAQFVHDQRPVS